MLTNSSAGVTGAITGLLVLAAGAAGLDLPSAVAAAIVGLAVLGVSVTAPRWAESRGILAEHPAGATASLVTVLVWLAPLVGIDLDQEQAVILVGGLAAVVGLLTPRETD